MTESRSAGEAGDEADRVRDVLRRVVDPEIGLNIVDLGLVYAIERHGGGFRIVLTMTSPACPMGDLIIDEARSELAAARPDDAPPVIDLVWDPPWVPAMMSPQARLRLGG